MVRRRREPCPRGGRDTLQPAGRGVAQLLGVAKVGAGHQEAIHVGRGHHLGQTVGALRTGRPAAVPRVHDGAVWLDPRCVDVADEEALLARVADALRAS